MAQAEEFESGGSRARDGDPGEHDQQDHSAALSPRAVKAIDALGTSGTYYFTKFRRAKNPRDWTGSVRQRLEYLCGEIDVPYGMKQGGITFHWATRRTGATRLVVGKRVPVPVVQQQGNWKTPDVLLKIYTAADKADLLKAVGQPLPTRSRKRRKSA